MIRKKLTIPLLATSLFTAIAFAPSSTYATANPTSKTSITTQQSLTVNPLAITNVSSTTAQPKQTNQVSTIQPSITINGKKISNYLTPPQLINGRIYVDVGIFEHSDIQGDVQEFLEEDYTSVSITHFHSLIRIDLNSPVYRTDYLSSEEGLHWSDVPWKTEIPFIENGSIMVPLREIAERLGIEVGWDNATRTAMLITDEAYRAELEPIDDWEHWIGVKPMKHNDPNGKAITEEELIAYFAENDYEVYDYKIIDHYTAIALTPYAFEYSEYEDVDKEYSDDYPGQFDIYGKDAIVLFEIQRLRNGELSLATGFGTGEDAEGFSVRAIWDYLSIVLYPKALEKEITHLTVDYYTSDEQREVVTYQLDNKKGILIPIPDVSYGTVKFYGKNNYYYETYFN